jgi:regulator of sirC expression with transglutaminase-like and TPR domain
MENGCGAFLSWTSHYNGQGELSKHTAMAKRRIKSLFYKNEHSLLFEKVMEILSKLFSTLEKDLDNRYSECQKVEKLLQCIQMLDMEVVAQMSVIVSQYACVTVCK